MADVKKGCLKPSELKGKPQDCSPEQIRKCHGDAGGDPCVETTGCERPERLKGKPGECSPEQIRECHGDVEEHPCVEKSRRHKAMHMQTARRQSSARVNGLSPYMSRRLSETSNMR